MPFGNKNRFQKFEFSNSEVSPTVYTDLKGPHPLSCQVVYRYLFNVKISLRPYSLVWKKKLTPHVLLLGMIFLLWFLRISANCEPYGLKSVAGSFALSWLRINRPVVTWSKPVSCRQAPFQEKNQYPAALKGLLSISLPSDCFISKHSFGLLCPEGCEVVYRHDTFEFIDALSSEWKKQRCRFRTVYIICRAQGKRKTRGRSGLLFRSSKDFKMVNAETSAKRLPSALRALDS